MRMSHGCHWPSDARCLYDRRMLKAVFSLALLLVGCGGGDDAQQQVTPDAPPGPACTGAVYDNCVNPTDCMSGNCHFYDQSNFTVCTQACTPGDDTTCPVDASGVHGVCNNKGLCKPAVANNCHL